MPFEIRLLRPADDPAVARIIRIVSPEFGADGPGFAIHDPEVDAMSAAYGQPRSAYFVVAEGARVMGGAGIGPLTGADPSIGELRKMYLLEEARGLGFGRALIDRCLDHARASAYRKVYLETLTGMTAAQRLYERMGFRRIAQPLGATGHFGCNTYYLLSLE